MRRGLLLLNGEIAQTIEAAARLGYDGIEVSLGNDIDAINAEDFSLWKEACLRKNLYMAAHAPSIDIRLDSANSGIRDESVRQILRSIEIAGRNIEYLTIHTGFVRKFSKMGSLEHLVFALGRIADAAADFDTNICVENVFERSIDEILDYFDLTCRPNLKMTFDIAHSVLFGKFDPLSVGKILFDTVRNIHVSDNNGEHDEHLMIGAGVMPISEVVRQFGELGFDGYVTVEARSEMEAEISLKELDRILSASGDNSLRLVGDLNY